MTPERWARIKEIFGSALEKPEQERRPFLEQACGADALLREEVERLLAEEDAPSLASPADKLLKAAPALHLAAGSMLGRYRIEAKLGEGGMGIVYKARDTRLGRSVALKFVKAQFSERFEREARAIAALNHPHIATLYEVGEHEGAPYLAMEFVEGKPLNGPRPVKEVIEYGIQVAAALATAHAAGIVHRDLKPANILVTDEGSAKILDFGLAKLRAQTGDATPATTILTGFSAGTPGYMSPEQIDGKRVDSRSDIFAFGCVLYELASGRHAFEGDSVGQVLGTTATQEPKPLDGVPQELEKLVRRCLRKDPEHRLQHIGDARIALEELKEESISARVTAAQSPMPPRRLLWFTVAVAALAILAVTRAFVWQRAPAPEIRSTQFLLEPPGDAQFTYPYSSPAASPDGRYLVFAAGPQGKAPLWLRPLDSLSARPLQGTENGNFPFWSPDSKSIAFYAGGKLKRSEIVGGAPQVLCDAVDIGSSAGTWSRDGVILFGAAEGLLRIPASGGAPQQVTKLDAARKESGHGVPQFLPDGKRFLYFIQSTDPNMQGIYAGSLDNPKERLRILATERKAYYVPPRGSRMGFLLWLREQTLLAQPFDEARLRLEGDATPLAEDVGVGAGMRAAFWTSDVGLLVYRTGGVSSKSKMIWMGRDSKRLGEVGKEDRYGSFRMSPDGKRVALGRVDDGDNTDIWVFEFGREVMTRLTFDPKVDANPVWSPDGRQIAYYSDRSGVWQIYWTDATGGGQEQQLTKSPNNKLILDWSRDGHYLLYLELVPKTGWDIWALPLEGERKPIAVLQTPFDEVSAQFSPDGKWIAYESNESGRPEVYVRAFPVSSAQWQVSSQGGRRPKWRADGKELFFLGPGSDKIMAAGIRVVGASFQSDKPRELFPVSPVPDSSLSPYDVTADGQRFLVWQSSTAAAQGPAPLTVVTNWQARLKK